MYELFNKRKGGEFMFTKKGFTLIELLIVVAIIAILAAIAVPNFLEAQTRSKVSRCQADMRSMSTAIESYAVQYNAYPMLVAPNSPFASTHTGSIIGPSVYNTGLDGVSSRFIWVTTPIAFITTVQKDPFQAIDIAPGPPLDNSKEYDTYDYVDARTVWHGGLFEQVYGGSQTRGSSISSGAGWRMSGCGPDHIQAYGGGPLSYGLISNRLGCDYDPTNGTISGGDVVRIGGGPAPYGGGQSTPAYDRIQNRQNF